MGKIIGAVFIVLLTAAGVVGVATLTVLGGTSFRLPSLSEFGLGAPAGPSVRLTFAVDQDILRDDHLHQVSERMAVTLREATPSIRYQGRGVRSGVAAIRLVDARDTQRALHALEAALGRTPEGEPAIVLAAGADNAIEARLAPERLQALVRQAAQQSVAVVSRRVNPGNRRGVSVALLGDDRILVTAAGVHDPEPLRRMASVQGRLTFHIVRELAPEQLSNGRAPAGAMMVEAYPGIGDSVEVVEQRVRMTGEHLERVRPSTDAQTGEFVLAFSFDAEGTRLFCRVTRDHVGERFAILLDNRALTAPRINEPVCGGSGQISGNFTAQSASELSTMLRAGALPVPLLLVDERIDSNVN